MFDDVQVALSGAAAGSTTTFAAQAAAAAAAGFTIHAQQTGPASKTTNIDAQPRQSYASVAASGNGSLSASSPVAVAIERPHNSHADSASVTVSFGAHA